VEGCDGFDEGDPSLFGGRGVVTNAARDDEEFARMKRHRAAVCFGAADAEEAAEDEEHLVLVLMGVPGELSLHLCHLDVLVIDLTNDSRRPKLLKSGACLFERDGVLLGLLHFEFGLRRHRGDELVAVTGADGDLMTALGAAAAEDGGTCLGLHTREEAVGLGAVAAIGLKGTLRHDKKLLRQEIAPAQTLAIAAISEYT
jgi:hypothetical protein